MWYWYDTEFIECGSGNPIQPVSIGIVAEDGREFYAQANYFKPRDASAWVRENVLFQLELCPTIDPEMAGYTAPYGRLLASMRGHNPVFGAQDGQCERPECPWRSHTQLPRDLLAFMDVERYGKPEIWGYYSAYDHVVFCQFFGEMVMLPKGFPMYTRDLKQWADMLGNPRLPEQGKGEHNALADARWTRSAWEFLKAYSEAGQP